MRILVALLLFPILTFAQQAVDPVQGKWAIHSRICSGGSQPNDGFSIGHDQITLTFLNGKYDGYTKVDNCNYWITGKYEVRGHMLRVFDLAGASNCHPNPRFSDQTQFFVVEGGQLKLYSGPFAPGGSCPRSEMLEAVFAPAANNLN